MSLLRQSTRALRATASASSSARFISTSAIARNTAHPNTSPAPVKRTDNQGRDLAAEQLKRHEQAVTADLVSSAPEELHQRTVRIFRPTKTANSSGKAGTKVWRVDFDILQGSARWENPLMGWASSGDYMQGTSLKFRSKEDAIHFCEKQGWDYHVTEPKVARIPPKSYAANYNYNPGKLRIHHTK
ncbi:probable NADH-ubiquinone oxidoreductase 21 kDa subunit, mitochondrial precursor [Ustilago sp. UG-2017a]|uniref:NADH dehydrogenase [ubiquinone] iron-sulfur protein 4, mitochondrial n=1 Tax=Ustilago bromivora TaxID=307758 RepID=A0A1K0FWS5_9BASI|nr:probable NADH-ubiquinone oxidoreductase 21 kDa subunit, mitochondrial precursor [Ustilago bromivora]SOV08185.1 probable NADH-ubiquinone oxidoreductase 21 kDa subunit, mitochondrial precursor [Ustilago sp. UG-2017a]SYW79244.1 probable NADH-ubiquinone oxidoreductase 21 kDa subunit, mitochondrial precursor [Ustilago bromivora]